MSNNFDMKELKSIKLYDNPLLKEEYKEINFDSDKNAENSISLDNLNIFYQKEGEFTNVAMNLSLIELEKIKDHSSESGEFGYAKSGSYSHVKIGEGIDVDNGIISASFSEMPEVQIINPKNNQVLQYDATAQKIKNIDGYKTNFTFINKDDVIFPKREKIQFINASFVNDTQNDTLIISRATPLSAQQVIFNSSEFPNSNAQEVIDDTLSILLTKAYRTHGSTTPEHGAGDEINYGHVRISDNINTNSPNIAASVNALLSLKSEAIPHYNLVNNMNIYRGQDLWHYFDSIEEIAEALIQEDEEKLQNIYLGDYIETANIDLTGSPQTIRWVVMDMGYENSSGSPYLLLVPENGIWDRYSMGGNIEDGYINSDMFTDYLYSYEEELVNSLHGLLYDWNELQYGNSFDVVSGHTDSVISSIQPRKLALLTEYEVFGGSISSANELDRLGGGSQQLRGFLYNPKLKIKSVTDDGETHTENWWLNSPGVDLLNEDTGYTMVDAEGIARIASQENGIIIPKVKFGYIV